MPQLAATRIGWENEHLAAYLLSKIAFVAHPAKIGDDVGSDFFCTLFQRIKEDRTEQLLPLNSFAIQVKSSSKKEPFSDKENYLYNLELPFFLGVIDRESLCLDIFSGENIPMMFSLAGRLNKLYLEPVTSDVTYYNAWEFDRKEKSCVLKLPKVITISAKDNRENMISHGKLLGDLCSRIHDNISAKKNKEYIFKVTQSEDFLIFAGRGSATTFRKNFCLRLAECFYNLEWLLNNRKEEFDLMEFKVYEELYFVIKNNKPHKISPNVLNLLDDIYGKLLVKIKR